MNSISTLVDNAIRKHIDLDIKIPELKENLYTSLEFRLLSTIDFSKSFREAKKEFLKNYVNDLLVLSLGNISMAARKAQLHRRHLHRMITDLEIDPNNHRKDMVKPTLYMKESVSHILEGTLSGFDEEKVRRIYSNLDDISEIIAENIDNISYDEALESFEKEYLEKALKTNGFNVQKTAEAAGMSERTLYRKINKLNIAVA